MSGLIEQLQESVTTLASDAVEKARQYREVVASVAALTERVDVVQGELAAHVADLRRHERHPAPPPPGADEPARLPQAESDAFVDALCRELRESNLVMDCAAAGWLRDLYSWKTRGTTNNILLREMHAAMLARAAALPERSAAATVTITWSRLSELLIVYVKAIPKGDTAHLTGLRAVVEALGYRMDGERT